MPRISSSPLGLLLNSETRSDGIGKYSVVSGAGGSTFSSIFSNTYTFNPNTTYDSDISTTSIVDYTKSLPAMKLNYSDFAYLKNLGVFPNNRLIIARRFQNGVDDDLTTLTNISPMSTMISWVPDNTDFISTDFGEDWVSGEGSFRKLLNDLGKDAMMGDNRGKNLGDFVLGGANAVPLPGFTEGLQYEVFKQLGFSDLDASMVPSGNPNLIRESKRRSTLDKEEPGSGLNCKFEVSMTVEYEQKFINGIDPTIVFYDILANALAFGTSEAQFQFSKDAGSNVVKFVSDVGSGDPQRLKSAMLNFVTALSTAISNVADELLNAISNETKKSLSQVKQDVINSISIIGTKVMQGIVSKYKLRIVSVVNSLTGSPSGPWHVTVGNPKRPILSSGDMIVDNVKLELGKVLAYNDLPASIRLTFKLKSARNIGSQEIFKKFNCGKARTYKQLKKSFVDTDLQITSSDIQNAQLLGKTKIDPNGKDSGGNPVITQQQLNSNGSQIFPPGIKSLGGVQYIKSQMPDQIGNYQSIASVNLSTTLNTSNGTTNGIRKIDFYPPIATSSLLNGDSTTIGTINVSDGKGGYLPGTWKSHADGSVTISSNNGAFPTQTLPSSSSSTTVTSSKPTIGD